jgi:hypothetical protein
MRSADAGETDYKVPVEARSIFVVPRVMSPMSRQVDCRFDGIEASSAYEPAPVNTPVRGNGAFMGWLVRSGGSARSLSAWALGDPASPASLHSDPVLKAEPVEALQAATSVPRAARRPAGSTSAHRMVSKAASNPATSPTSEARAQRACAA